MAKRQPQDADDAVATIPFPRPATDVERTIVLPAMHPQSRGLLNQAYTIIEREVLLAQLFGADVGRITIEIPMQDGIVRNSITVRPEQTERISKPPR